MMIEGSDVFVEDEDFISLVAAAEADALSVKRRKIDGGVAEKKEEGAYTAALKGSRSLQWQQQVTTNPLYRGPQGTVKTVLAGNSSAGGVAAGGGGGSCFKCGKLGHWARDCGALGGGGEEAENGNSNNSSVAEKPCPCGLGACLVLTANTEKNRGRKFYKCPVREENGGCGFFEWCDNSLRTPAFIGSQNHASNSSFPDLQCPCGVGSCSVLTAKTGKNVGQQFYCCPAKQGSSCGFFKWCNEHTLAAALPVRASQVYSNLNDASNKSYGGKNSLSCFKCGKEGHWAKDCPKPSFDSPIDVGGRSVSLGTCYKCGKSGHWARDCPAQDLQVRYKR